MHAVIETPTFIKDAADAGVTDDERERMIAAIAADPTMGVPIVGTGGARKVRFAGRGKGKSGGYRVVTFYAAADVPILMLALVSKGDRADISQAERNALKSRLSRYAEEYRAGLRRRVTELWRKE